MTQAVRRAGPEDVALMRTLSLESIRENPDNFVTTYDEQAAEPDQSFLDEITNGWLFIAGNDQGMIVLRPNGWVHTAYVRAGSRGQGLGDLLLEAVIEAASEAGIAKLGMGVFEENNHAVALYARHGFRIVSRTPYQGRSDCVMERAVIPDSALAE